MELLQVLERASMHVFSVECITTWKESGCASSMTNFEFCRDRPHSMELPTLVLMYSWSYVVRTNNCPWTVWEIPRSRYTHVTGRRRMSGVVFACRFEEVRLGHTFGSMRAWQPKCGCSETDLLLAETLERFSKPNFGSIRRFRTMTGLEIENWIEKRGRTVRKFRSTRPRTESNFRFGLTSCRSQNLPSEVRSLLCQVFDSFSLVTSSSSHHASHLRGFIRSLTRPKLPFNWASDEFFCLLLRQVHGHHQWMNGQEVLAMGSPVIEDLAAWGVLRTCTIWQRTLLWDTRTAIFYS